MKKKQITFFDGINHEVLQDEINKWIVDFKKDVVDIKFQESVLEGDYSILVMVTTSEIL